MRLRIRRQNIFAYVFTIFIVFLGIISRAYNVDTLILIAYSGFMVWILIKKRFLFLKYFFFIFMTSWMILSVYIIENNSIFIPNLQTISYRSGALGPLVIVDSLSILLVIHIDDSFKMPKSTELNSLNKNTYKIIVLLLFLLIISFLAEISNNNYFNSGAQNRFYYLMASSAISVLLYGYILFFYPIIAIHAEDSHKTIYIVTFTILYITFLVLIGNKFGAIIQVIYVIVLTYILPFKGELIKNHYRNLLIYAGVGVLLFLLYAYVQLYMERGSVALALENLYNRITNGQGDVWWGTYSKFKGTTHFNEIKDELGALNTKGLVQTQYNFGIYKLMRLIAPEFVVSSYGAIGARFTASTEASFYYYFGILGCIILKLILTYVMCFIVNQIVFMCKERKGIEGALYVWLLTHFIRIYSISDFYLILSKSTIFCLILLILLKRTRIGKYRIE